MFGSANCGLSGPKFDGCPTTNGSPLDELEKKLDKA